MDPGHLRVLVVDDDPDAAASTAALLNLSGFDCRAATSGAAALRLIPDFPPDVAVLDLRMPGMDGYELATSLRGRVPGKRPFLVAVSGCATAEDHGRSAAAGIDLHLDKPADPGVLVGVLRRFARLLAPTQAEPPPVPVAG